MGDLFDWLELRWLFGFVVAGAVATLAFQLRALTMSGAIAAIFVGGPIVATAGWWPGIVLVAFFATSSALSMYSSRHSGISDQVRGMRRDAIQVLANGGIPTLCAALSGLVTESGPWLVAMTSAVAGAASDTWATEIGRFNRSRPRLITTWKVAAAGTSGAISAIGTLGSIAGSLLIALVAAGGTLLGWTAGGTTAWEIVWIVTLAGFAGSILDSVLGATVQAHYRCPACDQPVETPIHRCGSPAVLIRGYRWMNNDTVNLVAILTSASLGLTLSLIWRSTG